jgi:hypothetical protein
MGRIANLVREMNDQEHGHFRRYAAISLCREIESADGAEIRMVRRCAVASLSRLLSDPDMRLEEDAIRALQAAQAKDIDISPAVPAIKKAAVGSASYQVRLFATDIIGHLIEKTPELASVLIKAVQDEDSIVANKALYPLEGFIRRCGERGTLEDMRLELNHPNELRRASRESCLKDLHELDDRKERRTMRKAIKERLGDLRDSDHVKTAKTLLTIRICELDYPTLKPPRRAGMRLKNMGRRARLILAV